ncbi:MAG: hypothetical protein ACTTKL_03835 [Treponema sp.]
MTFRKKSAAAAFAAFILWSAHSQESVSQNKKNFIRGNIVDKTAAVVKASGDDKTELSRAAIDFALAYKSALGEDRELSALAVAGILALPLDYAQKTDAAGKNEIASAFFKLYTLYADDTVKIAVLDKTAKLKLADSRLVAKLNDYVKSAEAPAKTALTKAAITALGEAGDKNSFTVLTDGFPHSERQNYTAEFNAALALLTEKFLPDVIAKIQSGNTDECRTIFDLTVQNAAVSSVYKAEIAENTLSRAIYIAENTGGADKTLIGLELDSFKVLTQLKWTRGAQTALAFFDAAKKEYESQSLDEAGFVAVVEGMAEVAPIESAAALSACLQNMSRGMEKTKRESTEPVVLAIINALGAIGDKSAFDPLLAVINNYNYSDTVVAAARAALAKLKW